MAHSDPAPGAKSGDPSRALILLLEGPEALSWLPGADWGRFLPPEKKERLRRLRAPDQLVQALGAALLLEYGLRSRFGCSALEGWTVDRGGKPGLSDPDAPCFSLSHCAAALGAAFGPSPLGLDLQERTAWDPAYGLVLSPEESKALSSAPDRDGFFTELWTRKEAYGKYLGLGLSYGLEAQSLLEAPEGLELWSSRRGDCWLSLCRRAGEEPPLLSPVAPETLLAFYQML